MPALTYQLLVIRRLTRFRRAFYVDSDRVPFFMSGELNKFHYSNGIVSRRTTVYGPQPKDQAERPNGTLQSTILPAQLQNAPHPTEECPSVCLSIHPVFCVHIYKLEPSRTSVFLAEQSRTLPNASFRETNEVRPLHQGCAVL